MVKINGKNYEINNVSLLSFLKENNYNIDVIAIEYNGNIIKKSEYSSIILSSGDKVEIVSFVGGG